MSKEKMSQEKVRPVISHLDLGAIDYPMDADGCRYDPRIRELLKRTGRRVDAGTEALAAVRMLGKKMHLMMERWADQHGLSEGRFQILVRLQHAEGNRMTMGELAEMLEVSPRTVTGLVDNLERHGLVRRVDDPDDRRSVYAELTDPGRERVKALWRDASLGQQGLTRNLAASELVQLRDICLRLIQAMNAEEAKTHATN
ncbi:MAG: MarR family transcriptional regulator [Chloroflexi bacterium]|nr:MAG: MarR family transcriptional regulator [Chloroflexota bacterium]